MSIMASQISGNSAVGNSLLRLTNKKNIRAPPYWPFVMTGPVDSAHKGPIIREAFPHHDFMIIALMTDISQDSAQGTIDGILFPDLIVT